MKNMVKDSGLVRIVSIDSSTLCTVAWSGTDQEQIALDPLRRKQMGDELVGPTEAFGRVYRTHEGRRVVGLP
jgi:hypothetical protein